MIPCMRDNKRDTDVYNSLLDSVGEGEGGRFGRMALKHVYYHMWNELPVQVRCMIQGARGWSIVAVLVCILTNSVRGFPFLHTLSSFFNNLLSSLSSEKAMAPHSSTLAWKIPWMEEPGRLQSVQSQRVRYSWATSLSLFTFLHWRRKWQPTPLFLPGESQGQGSLVGCRLWGRIGLDTTEAT